MSNRHANWWKPGSWNVSCQRTGFKIKVEDSRTEWNGLVVRKESWEPRHPQDFLRGIPDNPAVMYPRPRPTQIETNHANLFRDSNGQTGDGVFWVLGSDWGLLSGGGWEITATAPFNVSTDLVSGRGADVEIGPSVSVIDGSGTAQTLSSLNAVTVGDTLALSGTIKLVTRTAGSIAGQLRFYQSDRSTVVQTSTLFTVDADQDARSSGTVTVPAAAAFVQTLWNCTSLQADTLELTNIKLELGSLTGFTESVSY